jgi:hypothetical protein
MAESRPPLGKRENLAATILTLFLLMVFVIPAMIALDALFTHLTRIDVLTDPVLEWIKGPPPAQFDGIPLVGDNLT